MVLGQLPVPGPPTIWMIVGQEPISLVVGAGGGCLDIFPLSFLSSFPSLLGTARYRLKYYLKEPLIQTQTNKTRLYFAHGCFLFQCGTLGRLFTEYITCKLPGIQTH